MANEQASQFMTFRGKPLVRSGNMLFYGNLSDPYVVMMQILDTKPFKDVELANKIHVELQLTDPAVKPRERIVNSAEKTGFYAAMDIATTWLERALNEK